MSRSQLEVSGAFERKEMLLGDKEAMRAGIVDGSRHFLEQRRPRNPFCLLEDGKAGFVD